MTKFLIILIIIILLGILIPKFLISSTFSDEYNLKTFECVSNQEAGRNKLFVLNYSFGLDPASKNIIVKEYTYFGIKLDERKTNCAG